MAKFLAGVCTCLLLIVLLTGGAVVGLLANQASYSAGEASRQASECQRSLGATQNELHKLTVQVERLTEALEAARGLRLPTR